MVTMVSVIAIVAIGYILGSIPTAQIVMHLFRKQDLRKVGTGSVTTAAESVFGSETLLLSKTLKSCICVSFPNREGSKSLAS